MLTLHEDVRIDSCDMSYQYHIVDLSKPVVLCFAPGNSGTDRMDMQQNLWGFDYLKSRKMNVLSITHNGQQNFYQSQACMDIFSALGECLAVFPERIAYGSSRGCFAIGLHAKRLGLDRALMMMPVSSMNAELAPQEPKVKQYGAHPNWQGPHNDAAICDIPLTVICDSLYPADHHHCRRFSNVVQFLRLPGVGHRVPSVLNKMGMLSKVVIDYLHNEIDTQAFYKEARKRRQLNVYYRQLLRDPTGKLTTKRKFILRKHQTHVAVSNLSQQLSAKGSAKVSAAKQWLIAKKPNLSLIK
ncbi:hypothetical protein [Shewanella sp. Scap07]|uniref:hypothetical protein n=1 Tax=Shewanella sp. Scap07 TaxID=2589987 RepID=UPI002117AD7C|nr:hypothetical protein [Shewanella sp. Scap07]